MTLPLTIIGGYLGAGKTTLVNHLLRHADGVRLAILVNEFGELPIDQDLIESQDENVISIAGGCVCCSYGNDLTLALMDMTKLDPPPDHVLLEASGVALPGAIAASVSLLQGYALDGIVVLANAETIEEHARDVYVGDTIERQLSDADLVVLNKTDLVSDAERNRVADWLKTQATQAEIVAAQHGVVPPAILLQSFVARDRSEKTEQSHRTDVFRTIAVPVDWPVDAIHLAEGLSHPELGVIRAKGFVQTSDGDKKTIQVVARQSSVSEAPQHVATGFVAIGHRSNFDEAAIRDVVARSRIG